MPISQFKDSNLGLTDMPIFPLPVFILPKGRQKLRIFEAKYLTMVMASLEGKGFIMSLPRPKEEQADEEKNLHPVNHWGTLVKVVDFDQGEDCVLLIDVEGQYLVSLHGFHYQEDGLLLGNCRYRQHWPDNPNIQPMPPKPILVTTLKSLFYQYPELDLLYPITQFDSAQWVNARLLEVLPVPHQVKSQFIQPDSLPSLTHFLLNYIQGNSHEK